MMTQTDVNSFVGIARAQAKAGMKQRARKIMEALIDEAPEDVNVMLVLGALRYEDRDLDGAGELFERVVARDAVHPIANAILGEIALGRRDLTVATKRLGLAAECVDVRLEPIRRRAILLLKVIRAQQSAS